MRLLYNAGKCFCMLLFMNLYGMSASCKICWICKTCKICQFEAVQQQKKQHQTLKTGTGKTAQESGQNGEGMERNGLKTGQGRGQQRWRHHCYIQLPGLVHLSGPLRLVLAKLLVQTQLEPLWKQRFTLGRRTKMFPYRRLPRLLPSAKYSIYSISHFCATRGEVGPVHSHVPATSHPQQEQGDGELC